QLMLPESWTNSNPQKQPAKGSLFAAYGKVGMKAPLALGCHNLQAHPALVNQHYSEFKELLHHYKISQRFEASKTAQTLFVWESLIESPYDGPFSDKLRNSKLTIGFYHTLFFR